MSPHNGAVLFEFLYQQIGNNKAYEAFFHEDLQVLL
jgi:hypothetical protein